MLIYIGNSREARAVFLVSLPFEYMLMLDSGRTIWFQTPKISADGSYAAQRCLKVEGERKTNART